MKLMTTSRIENSVCGIFGHKVYDMNHNKTFLTQASGGMLQVQSHQQGFTCFDKDLTRSSHSVDIETTSGASIYVYMPVRYISLAIPMLQCSFSKVL